MPPIVRVGAEGEDPPPGGAGRPDRGTCTRVFDPAGGRAATGGSEEAGPMSAAGPAGARARVAGRGDGWRSCGGG